MKARTFLLTCTLTLAAPALAVAVPNVKAKLEEPVLEELMAGCSLRCSFVWTVQVQTSPTDKPRPVKTLNDENAQSPWIAGENAIGTRLTLSFPKKIHAEIDGHTPFYGLDLINGHWKTEELWEQHARVKKVRLSYNGKPFRDVQFADSRRWQRLSFPDFFIRSGDFVTIEILEIYPGKGAPLAISEIVLQGGH